MHDQKTITPAKHHHGRWSYFFGQLQRWCYIGLWLLLLSLVAWGFSSLMNPEHFPVEHVQIHADYRYVSRQVLEDTILPYMDKSFFTLNIEKIRLSLLKLPWVDEVIIRKIWPDQLDVEIYPKQAVARIGQDKLLSSHGAIFQPPLDTFPPNLLQLNGADEQIPLMWQQYQAMSLLLKPLGLSIAEVDLNARQAWQLRLNNGMQILLGRTDIIQRLKRLTSVYQKIISKREESVTAVDLRYSNGLAVKFKNSLNPGKH